MEKKLAMDGVMKNLLISLKKIRLLVQNVVNVILLI